MIPISNRKWKGVKAAINREITEEFLQEQLTGITEYQRSLIWMLMGRKYF